MPDLFGRLGRWISSHRLLAAGAAACVIFVLLFLLGVGPVRRCPTEPSRTCDWEGIPFGRVTQQDMLTRAETTLYFPGSHVLQQNVSGYGPREFIFSSAATAYTVSAAEATPAAIVRWYDGQLRDRGWVLFSCATPRSANPYVQHSFVRGTREVFSLEVYTVDPPAGIGYTGGGTVYEFTYQLFSSANNAAASPYGCS